MPLEAKEIPKIIFWLALLGGSSYLTFWIVTKIKEQISNAVRD